ncbi:MAG: matrixin family metalloprotease, partial [Oligoflexia bacterium]|nr:matrixin family metalloprotease [Oligoflexia bacterium]
VAQKGARWKELPVRIQVNPGNSGLSAGETEKVLSKAMQTWNSGVGYETLESTGIDYSIDASKVLDRDGKNAIAFSDNFYLESSGFDSDLVVAIGGQYGNGEEMTDGFVLFNSEMVAWTTDNESGGTRGMYTDDLETVALHELGHVLGLGHSEQYEAVMSAQRMKQQVRELTNDDITGAKFLTSASAQGGSAFSDSGGCGFINNPSSGSSANNGIMVSIMILLPGTVLIFMRRKAAIKNRK